MFGIISEFIAIVYCPTNIDKARKFIYAVSAAHARQIPGQTSIAGNLIQCARCRIFGDITTLFTLPL
jgi:hypothetical protein